MATLLKGLVAILTTAHIEDKDTGTDDHIYIGLVGRGGGREFALATEEEDFEVQPPGKPEVFLLGSFWDNPAASVPQAKNTLRSAPGGDNDPARFEVDLDLVDYVYLRKQGERSFDGRAIVIPSPSTGLDTTFAPAKPNARRAW